jgi:hypothetical protein
VRAQKEAAACSTDGRERRHAAYLRERTPLHSHAELSTSPSTALSGAASHRCHRWVYAVLAFPPYIDIFCAPSHCCSAPTAQLQHTSALVRSRPVASPLLSPSPAVHRMIAGRGRQRIRPPRRVRLSPSLYLTTSAAAQHPLPIALWPLPIATTADNGAHTGSPRR